MAIAFNEITHYVEFVDYIPKNASDSKKVVFRCSGDPIKIIKWCRRNFGERGDGWDFNGSGKKVDIIIWSSKLITMYELWQN